VILGGWTLASRGDSDGLTRTANGSDLADTSLNDDATPLVAAVNRSP
jgi:hypothetical protein